MMMHDAGDRRETFKQAFSDIVEEWFRQKPFDRGEVHAQKITTPEMVTRELTNVTVILDVPNYASALQHNLEPNLPWAEDHFKERVGGEPLNPPPAEAWWPFAQQGNSAHKKGELFSHTYPERFWPKEAGWDHIDSVIPHFGIRFRYGDLGDVVEVLRKNPRSRQAYLPVWFPEDLTASVQGERVPCTLGYHFLQHADGKLHMNYHMRSCDLVRFFTDDLYMAARLLQWVCEKVAMSPGTLEMHIANLHAFQGDEHWLRQRILIKTDPRQNYNWSALG